MLINCREEQLVDHEQAHRRADAGHESASTAEAEQQSSTILSEPSGADSSPELYPDSGAQDADAVTSPQASKASQSQYPDIQGSQSSGCDLSSMESFFAWMSDENRDFFHMRGEHSQRTRTENKVALILGLNGR